MSASPLGPNHFKTMSASASQTLRHVFAPLSSNSPRPPPSKKSWSARIQKKSPRQALAAALCGANAHFGGFGFGGAASEPPELPPGLEDYTLERPLGKGMFGAVWLGRHSGMGLSRPVAVKVCALDDEEETSAADVAHEAEMLARLFSGADVPASRLLPRLFAYQTDALRAALVLQYFEGVELREHASAAGGLLSEVEARRLTALLLEALAHAHRKGVAHGDVKPENVLVTVPDAASLMLVDFGSASAFDPEAAPRVAERGGTPNFMAPERHLAGGGGAQHFDGRASDVWSAGCVLFSLLRGRAPYDWEAAEAQADAEGWSRGWPEASGHAAALLRRVRDNDPFSCGEEEDEEEDEPPPVSGSTERLVRLATRFEPSERPTAARLREELLGAAVPESAFARLALGAAS
ncbi:hypothetical protein EMIHUDRAFT_228852 [Emiliania huxleyi CCMP1516]|uniref:NEK6-subfamily protein kinase n=4 Tax=Emiliania huxleyi TaxID=2903 RepID=A0A0D3KE27_EMIH1|nr:hypothetical protein EMIHUDRAFT_228852 [Emiliania huxleyi CCMP1516]EOD34012.1 hypothetical protein EMIHUDRAFT_228852 [Emiliania huxleyi CCMP1516]|eukprot:XP_005786441.1 hypothetical protein EMIHUDRAFT_228852 [Emiliania huxleyi CCMP1516]